MLFGYLPISRCSIAVNGPHILLRASDSGSRFTHHVSRMTYPKRLIEVDLPIKRISAHARREKSIRHGHISTLHIWWARRPLAACRAVICAALWPDPADPAAPPPSAMPPREIILDFARKVTSDTKLANDHCSPENFKLWQRLAGGAGFQPVAQPGRAPKQAGSLLHL